MPIEIGKLQEFAEKLANDGEEVALRASVSRSYYVTFHSLLPFVKTLPKSAKHREASSDVTHFEMQCRLEEWITDVNLTSAVSKAKRDQICRALNISRALRVRADYHLNAAVTKTDAMQQIDRTRRLLEAVSQIG